MRLNRILAVTLLAVTMAPAALLLPAAPAGSQATLTVTPTALPSGSSSVVTVAGRGYLIPPHTPGASVFGGVYVLFGWVQAGSPWGPSARNGVDTNGQFGFTYSYAGEGGSGETRDDGTGINRFVAFTPGGIDADATPFHMDGAGNWSVTLTIPSPVYEWTDPATERRASVDCRVVQCGVYTIGAHGRSSSTNEAFAPITFESAPTSPGAPTPAPSGGGAAPSAGSPPGGSTAGGGSPSVAGSSTQRRNGSTATTTTVAAAPVVGDTTTLPPDTTVAPEVTSTTIAVSERAARDDTVERAGDTRNPVITIEAAEDGGIPLWLWGPALALPVLGAAGLLARRSRSHPTTDTT